MAYRLFILIVAINMGRIHEASFMANQVLRVDQSRPQMFIPLAPQTSGNG
jgi:hypothetical protein